MGDTDAPRSIVKTFPWSKVGMLAGVVLGAVLLLGAFGKVIDPIAFAELIEIHGLDFLIPSSAVVYIALTLEVGLGVALLLDVRRLFPLIPAAVVVALFIYLTGSDYIRSLTEGPTHNCGCFGNLVDRSPGEAFWQDLALMVPTLGLAFLGMQRPGSPLPWGRLGVMSGVTVLALVFTALAPGLPLDDFATRLKPGIEITDICAGRDDDQTCFDAVNPMFAEGAHIVVIADVFNPDIQDPLNTYAVEASGMTGPYLTVVSPQSEEVLEEFKWSELSPSFEVVHAPIPLVRPLYRTLPRSFLIENGRVTRTWAGLPPFGDLVATDP